MERSPGPFYHDVSYTRETERGGIPPINGTPLYMFFVWIIDRFCHLLCLACIDINISVSWLITPVSISVSHGWSRRYQYQCLTDDHASINISVWRLITPVSISASDSWSRQYQYQRLTADHAIINISVLPLITPLSISVSDCVSVLSESVCLLLLFLRLLQWLRSYWYVLLVILVVLVIVCVFLCACILRKKRSHRHTLPMELRR